MAIWLFIIYLLPNNPITTLAKEPFENIVGKDKNAGENVLRSI